MRVLVAGSISYDSIMNFPGLFADRIMPDRIHRISLSFLVTKLSKQFGGTATNISYNLNLLGVEPIILATAGDDFASLRSFMRKNNISSQYVKTYKDVSTSTYFVITDKDDNQIGSFYVGAQKYASKLSLKPFINNVDLVMIAPTDPKAMIKYVKECRQYNLPYFYAPTFQLATFTPTQLREGVEGAHILFGNDYEIALMKHKLEISHEELVAMVPILITTLGSRGSVIETRTDSIHVKAVKTHSVVDPTGAGDAYQAGFIAGHLRNYDVQISGQMGATTAAYTVEKYGTVTHKFTKKDFIKRYKDNFGTMIAL
ncbi:hypothetical protein A3A79_00955 [Candidatus Gottesmanbacteria bacterium RIFCSPLOWO2_01_FULL_43_11b]|uniref:Carbohydrate kinase PfkB domain-containing protein n=1 Tax=Candidatus Gottesmanbacteria bacterium RIFCSPLOWO2_01_FULL_43_11b TaxID=1798392 RepID=A0A1F6AG82_9BACT|nr:MAG: hypothetical protein A3A79_00955 [Candidatus Gottesmanbacteria bacterium RIFCSPLOWO2_01_FULL_43_11b]